LQDKGGKSPLHFACIYSQFDIAKFLLQNKAEVDIVDKNGNTPLFDAVFNSKGEGNIIKLLLSHGANPDIENNYEVSPKSLAETIANFDVSHLFV
jgi:ankyrin repeat protein